MPPDAPAPRLRSRTLLEAVGSLVALALGAGLWYAIAFAGKGYASTKTRELALLLFLSPVLGAFLPWAIRSARRGWYAAGVLLLAVAPLASVLNLVVCVLSFDLVRGQAATQWAWAGLWALLWATPWLSLRKK
jgi:hypothetical protein